MLENIECIKYDCDISVSSFIDELKDFQKTLSNEEELFVLINGLSFRLEKIRHEHNTIYYYGSTKDNVPVVLCQYYRQLNVLFFAAQKRYADKPAVRIGFVVE